MKIWIFIAGFLLGFVLAAAGLSILVRGQPEVTPPQSLYLDMLSVHSIRRFEPNKSNNAEATLRVYVGKGRHVMDIECWFPPGFEVGDDRRLRIIQVSGVAIEPVVGKKTFWCERAKP